MEDKINSCDISSSVIFSHLELTTPNPDFITRQTSQKRHKIATMEY